MLSWGLDSYYYYRPAPHLRLSLPPPPSAHPQAHTTYSSEKTLQEHTTPVRHKRRRPPVPALSLGPDAIWLTVQSLCQIHRRLLPPTRKSRATSPPSPSPSLCTSVSVCHLHLERFLPFVLASGSPSRELVHCRSHRPAVYFWIPTHQTQTCRRIRPHASPVAAAHHALRPISWDD